jgi:hypothetical protein
MTTADALSDFAARWRRFMAHCLAGHGSPRHGTGEEFGRLALELFRLQFNANAAYRKLCLAGGRSPATVSRWSNIPAAPTSAFKELKMTSLPEAARTTVFHSSGTTGQRPSRHFHSAESLSLYEESLIAWFQARLAPAAGMTFIALTPGAAQASRSSLVHMLETVSKKFGPTQCVFCGEVEADGAWSLDFARAESALHGAVATARPVVVMGTAFNFVHLLDGLVGRQCRIELPAGSRVLETGGYKGRSRELTKTELHGRITEQLGVPADHIVCEYGMSELSSQAYDLSINSSRLTSHSSRMLRFPPWACAQVISPETGREVAEGETGLLRLFDLANVWSVMAVQTEDLAIRQADGFELRGRAAAAEPRGCSLMAV